MNKLAVLLPAVALAASPSAWARTVSVSSFDAATGETVLAISDAEAGDGDKALVAAWSATQISGDASDIRESACVGIVSAAETSKSLTIPAAWRAKSGVVRFFLMAGTPPYDARLASIRSASAGPYIDTGFVPTKDSDIRVTARYVGTSAPFGVFGSCQFFDASPDTAGDTEWYYRFLGAGNGSSAVSLATSGSDRHEYWLNARGAFIDGLCKVAFDPAVATETATSTLTLFGRRRDPVDKQGDITIYGATISTNGVVAHDYVPCRNSDGTVTLYDRQTQTFCEVSGSGSFVAGDETGPAPEDCGGVESATDALVLAPRIKAVVKDSSTGLVEIKLKGSHGAGVLYWVGGESDAGMALAGWQATNFLCKVAADASTVATNIPPEWLLGSKSIRIVWRSAEDVPYDHEVEWLHSSGSAYVNTGIRPTMQTEIAIRGKSAYDVCLFGLTKCFYMFCNSTMGAYGFFGKAGTDMGPFNPTEFHTLELGPSGAYLDGSQKAVFHDVTFVEPKFTMTVFFRKSNDNASMTKTGDCTIQWAKICESGRVVRDLVPCVAGGEACFYDRATRSFLRSEVPGASFEAGGIVASITERDVLAWSDVVDNAPMVIVIR